MTALSAANVVPVTHIGDSQRPIRVNDLKPPQCAALNLTTISSNFFTYPSNALLLATSGNDFIWGGFWAGSNVCIVGGGGDDTIWGGTGNEIILGGPGDDTITGGGGWDICYGGGGNNSIDCEESY